MRDVLLAVATVAAAAAAVYAFVQHNTQLPSVSRISCLFARIKFIRSSHIRRHTMFQRYFAIHRPKESQREKIVFELLLLFFYICCLFVCTRCSIFLLGSSKWTKKRREKTNLPWTFLEWIRLMATTTTTNKSHKILNNKNQCFYCGRNCSMTMNDVYARCSLY